jgi:alpha-mannosidase
LQNLIYLTPHAHYDVVWAFTKQDYLFIYSSILKKAMRMIREDNFKFLIEQTFPLETLEYQNPELFSEIEEQIASGKVEIVDGQYIMADPIIPTGEVLVREILVGKKYAKEKFNVDVPVAWAADGFGLNSQLPQIYNKAGYKWLAFRRGLPKSIGSRVSEFTWEGLDGSTITAHWMPLGYRAGLRLPEWPKSFQHLAKLATTRHVLMPCGSGGAIPQEDIPEKLAAWNETHENTPMIMATPRQFFEAFDKEKPDLITFSGELYSDELENIFPDVSSSRIRLRLAIRYRELEILMAEKSSTLAYLFGKQYPQDTMKDLWKKMLFLAMHDVVPGCGIDEIYDEAWEYIQEMRKVFPSLMRASLTHLMPGKGYGTYVAVFNANNWEVTSWVSAHIELGEGWTDDPGVSFDGDEIPSEVERISRWEDGSVAKAQIGFLATVPPLGVRIFNIVRRKKSFNNSVTVNDNRVESKYFNVEVDRKTGILTIFDKENKQLVKGNEVIIDEEIGDLYFHRSLLDKHIGAEGGGGLHFGIFKPTDFHIEKGNERTIITFKDSFYCLRWPYYLIEKYPALLYRHKTIDLTKTVIVYRNIPRIDLVTHLNLLQSHIQVRLRFDTGMITPEYTRHTQFGAYTMPEEKVLKESMKIPSMSWIAAEEGDRGVAFMTQGVPINEIKSGEIFYTLIRSVSVLSADGTSGPLVPVPKAQELGEHTYHYSIFPYKGNWREVQVYRRGQELSQPLKAFQMNRKPFENELHTFTLAPDSLMLSALKQAEDNTAVIMRFYETLGEPCTAIIGLVPQVTRVELVNLLEEKEAELEIKDGKVELEVKPFEIITLKMNFDSSKAPRPAETNGSEANNNG